MGEPGLKTLRGAWQLRKYDDNSDNQIAYYQPHELVEEFEKYVEWVNDNPLREGLLLQKTGKIVEVPKMRAMSIRSFCLFLGITQNTFNGYEKKLGYKNICSAIRDAIYVQKFEGASAGLLHAGIIQRDLGLQDNINHNLTADRKTVDELFPDTNEIDDVEIVDTKELPYETSSSKDK